MLPALRLVSSPTHAFWKLNETVRDKSESFVLSFVLAWKVMLHCSPTAAESAVATVTLYSKGFVDGMSVVNVDKVKLPLAVQSEVPASLSKNVASQRAKLGLTCSNVKSLQLSQKRQ